VPKIVDSVVNSFWTYLSCQNPKCAVRADLDGPYDKVLKKWNTRVPDPRIQVLREALEAIVPEREDWWCPTCKASLDGSRVTNGECCDTCGTYLGGINTPEWITQARAALEQTKETL
jgi:hypothetical protein